MTEKTLKEIEQKKIEQSKVEEPALPQIPIAEGNVDKLQNYPSNYILNVIKTLKESQKQEVWFDVELPSNGILYPKNVKIRELSTDMERILIKEMFSNKENAILNMLKKCTKFEDSNFDYGELAIFDQEFLLLELSAITFPGKKNIVITDAKNHKIEMDLNKEELELKKMKTDEEYPLVCELKNSGLIWKFEFLTLNKMKQIETSQKSVSNDLLSKLFLSIAQLTHSVEIKDTKQKVEVDNFHDYFKLLEALSPSDQQKIIEFYNEKVSDAYGYKLTKTYYCAACGEEKTVDLDPLSWFRIAL